jgi:hypothetical protein
MSDAGAARWRGEAGFFEIWFVVVFDRDAARAWWLRYTTFAPREGTARGTIWAAAFEAGRPARWGKRIVAIDDVRRAVAALAAGRCTGAVETEVGTITWDLEVAGGERPVRGPAWLHRVPAPTHVAHLRAEADVTGTVACGEGPVASVRGTGAVKHLWGTRRVEQLFWIYCPVLEGGGAFEATSVRVRHGRGPQVTPVWLRTGARERHWWNPPGVFRHRVEPDGPGRLRVRARSAKSRLEAIASCDPRTLAGYVYRDPSGFDVHVAQSDVAACEVELRTRAHPFARWGEPRRFAGRHAAIEFHHPEPLPGVRYVGWDETKPSEATT